MPGVTFPGMGEHRDPGVSRNRPRRHRRRRPRRGDRLVRSGPSGSSPRTSRSTRSRGCARRCCPRRDGGAAIQLLAPLAAGLGDRQVSSTATAPASSRWPTAWSTSRRRRKRCGPRANGCSTPSHAAGTAGSRINFVHPKDAGGVLVELVEPAAALALTDSLNRSRWHGDASGTSPVRSCRPVCLPY